ncbi:hypothetical protein [Sphingomicrobium flavum]|uniref:hypothetical protein n=1 Tax=Sphingomicrobium flavum TaxID=1229164 RepID=UPI0021ADAA35|nr:hypothetical protein [Sphingomicrobium flavum]
MACEADDGRHAPAGGTANMAALALLVLYLLTLAQMRHDVCPDGRWNSNPATLFCASLGDHHRDRQLVASIDQLARKNDWHATRELLPDIDTLAEHRALIDAAMRSGNSNRVRHYLELGEQERWPRDDGMARPEARKTSPPPPLPL